MSSTMKESSAFQSELRMPESAIRHQSASPADKGKVTICDGKSSDDDKPKKSSVCKNIEGCREDLLIQVVWEFLCSSFSESVLILEVHLTYCNHYFSQASSSTAALVLELLVFLMDAIQTNFQQASAVGSSSRAQHALNELHTQDKTVEMTDQLMVWTKHLKTNSNMHRYLTLTCFYPPGSHTGLTRRRFWERQDELQWRSRTDHPPAHQRPCASSCGHVCAVVPSRTQTAPRCQPWEGQGNLRHPKH